MFHFRLLFLIAVLTGCTTDRVGTEVADLSKAINDANTQIIPRLAARIESEKLAEIRASAANGDAWFLSDDCEGLLSADAATPLESCEIEKIAFGDRAPQVGPAMATKRKLETLSGYLAALELLSSASTQEEVVNDYTAALGALGSLGAVGGSDGVASFLEKRREGLPKVDGVVSQAVGALRYRRLEQVVLAADDTVASLAREIQGHLIALDFDPGYSARVRSLIDADIGLNSFDPQTDPEGYFQAIQSLQSKRDDLETFYRGTQIYKVGLIGQVHSSLANAMRNPASADDAFAYLKSLKDLAEVLGE